MQKGIFKKSGFWLSALILLAAILRIPELDKYPPGIYSDEVSQGYNAYSILRTGRDEYGIRLPVSFRSFGDWKPPLQTYLMVPTVALFGLNAWGVRLPSAILGVGTILLVYLLIKELLTRVPQTPVRQKLQEKLALMAALFLTVSPWHILQSRSAMLVGVALFFLCLGIWAFLRGLTKPRYFLLSSAGFVLATYSYYGMRVVAPLVLLVFVIYFRKRMVNHWKMLLVAGGVGLVLLLPLFNAFRERPDVIFGRAKTVSIFYDKGVALTVWDLIAQDGVAMPPKLAQFFHNKPYYYSIDIIRRTLQHLDGRFLFLVGDVYSPFQIPGMGVLYLVDAFLLLAGSIYLVKSSPKIAALLIVLMIIFIFPAALTFLTPVSNRTFSMIIPLSLVSACGMIFLVKRHKWLKGILVVSYALCAGWFIYNYFLVLPLRHANWWHWEYRELVSYLETQESTHDHIAISGQATMPYIFLLFYRQIDPSTIESQIRRNYHADEFGFERVDSFGKYDFLRNFRWQTDVENLPGGTLLVTTGEEKEGSGAKKLRQILYPDGGVAFNIFEIDKK